MSDSERDRRRPLHRPTPAAEGPGCRREGGRPPVSPIFRSDGYDSAFVLTFVLIGCVKFGFDL
jgi:hypothetical protein